MIATETIMPNKKLKIKFATKRVEAAPGTKSCELGQQVSLVRDWDCRSSLNGNNRSEMSKTHSSVIRPSGIGKKLDVDSSKAKSSMLGANKRGPPELIECQKEKRQKMERSATLQCNIILKKMMSHPAGWVFNQPVDPVALNIPDYFSIITKPMDLGTIKSKLQKNMYFGAEEFAADVRLTFSNAMLYNPPENSVHKMADELNKLFETRWKPSEEKVDRESSKVGQAKLSSGQMKGTTDTRQNCHKTPPLRNNLLLKRSMPSLDKVRRSSSDGKDVEVQLAKTAQTCAQKSLGKDLNKGIDSGSRQAGGSVNAKPPLSPVARKCGTCGSIACHCSLPCDSTHVSSSDLTSERSLDRDHHVCSVEASRLDCQAKSTSLSQVSRSDLDSDVAVSAVDDENTCHSSQLTPPTTDAASGEGWNAPAFDVQMSPKKALRAAMLKSRFAETILKAQQKTLLDHGDKADPMKMQKEKERLERRQREERARIEAQIRAAETASRMKEAAELKQQREKEREAARLALQKMERTVEIEQNVEIVKELERLSGCCLSYHLYRSEMGAYEGGHPRILFERLGLFIKDEYIEFEEDDVILHGDGEEGEILS